VTPDALTVDGTPYVRAYPVAPGRCAHCGSGPHAWTPPQILDALQRDGAPKADEWLRPGNGTRPTFSTVRRIFGSWNNALEAAGFPRRGPGTVTYWTCERISGSMIAWEHAHGRQPTCTEWERAAPDHPASRQVVQRFGSWNKAIAEAGMTPRGSYGVTLRDRTPGAGRQLVDSAPVVSALRHYIGPEGTASILAERMGIDPTPLHKLLQGKRSRIEHRAADRILTAIDRPDVLAGLEAA